MTPALSVVVFTVLAGAALGAFVLLALFEIAGLTVATRQATDEVAARAGAIAFVLIGAGLLSSTLHLANPRNAWRSATRWRTSWLSREMIVALAFLPVAAGFVAAVAFDASSGIRAGLAIATLVLALALLYCTAMIYASLKPIRQWHTPRVPLNFLLLSLASGGVVLVATLRAHGEVAEIAGTIVTVLVVVAALVKWEYWRFVAGGSGSVTLEQAIGVAHGVGPKPVPGRTTTAGPSVMAARLLDAGHSRGTFLTDEFGHRMTPSRRRALIGFAATAGAAVPLAWLTLGLHEWRGALLAALACVAGLLAERWLFFADARHTVMLYHGDRRT